MSEQARKVFDIEEQKAKDVLTAIKAIVPVISLIREWGKVEQEYKQIAANNNQVSKEIGSINHVIGLACNGGELQESLSKILEEKSSKYKLNSKKAEELKSICDDMESEIISYQNYAEGFDWITKNRLEKVLELNTFDKEEFLSMMFLLLNANASYEVRKIVAFKYATRISKIEGLVSSDGWNYMLKELKANKL